MTNQQKEYPLLKKQNFLLGKWLALINTIILILLIIGGYVIHILKKKEIITESPAGIVLVMFASVVLLTTANNYMFGKYLNNFNAYASKRLINMMIGGSISVMLGIVVAFLVSNHYIAVLGLVMFFGGLALYIVCRLRIAQTLYEEINDHVGGIEEGIMVKEKWSISFYTIVFMPYYIYNVFSYALDYAQENGVEE